MPMYTCFYITCIYFIYFYNIATRVKWSKQEEKEVKEYFSDCYKSKTLPGMKMCLRLIESNKKAGGVLWKRKWETIKKKIWNDLKRLK